MVTVITSKRRFGIDSKIREQRLSRPTQKPAPTFTDALKDSQLADAHSSYGTVYTRTENDLHGFLYQLVHEPLEEYFNEHIENLVQNNIGKPDEVYFQRFKRLSKRLVYGDKQFDVERVIVENLTTIILDNKSGIVVQGHGYITQVAVAKAKAKPGHVTFHFAARLTIETGEPVTVDRISTLYTSRV